MTSHPSIAFIGGGNMARSLIGGLIARGTPASAIRVSEPVAPLREALAADFGVATGEDNAAAAAGAGLWLLAVKPQVMRAVCEPLAPLAQAERPLVVSIAAGITAAQLHANGHEQAANLLSSAGKTVWIDNEARMDAVTAASGSGPAYIFLLAEAMEAAAVAEGLPPEAAATLVRQTVLGAARMLTESGEDPAELRRRVTSPGGTTQAAIETFEAGGFRALVAEAIRNATERGRQLSAAND
jgi:pyrroline-5-carboxylate reductase